jgi:hypothetical protein
MIDLEELEEAANDLIYEIRKLTPISDENPRNTIYLKTQAEAMRALGYVGVQIPKG